MNYNNYVLDMIKTNKVELIYLFSAVLGNHYRVKPLANGLVIYDKSKDFSNIDIYNHTMPLSELFILVHLNDNTCKLINLNDLLQSIEII